jgi:hypothetical protein
VTNVNDLCSRADTDLIAILHVDDWWEPSFLFTAVSALDQFPAAAAAVTSTQFHHSDHVETISLAMELGEREPFLCSGLRGLQRLVRGCTLAQSSTLYRRGILANLDGFDVTLPQTCDWLFWLRVLSSHPIAVDPSVQANYSVHGQSLSARAAAMNLYALDFVRLFAIVDAFWAEQEPFVGARREFRHVICTRLLEESFRQARRGERSAALQDARRAHALATSRLDATASILARTLIHVAPSKFLSTMHRPLSALATLGMRSRRASQ